MLAFFAGFILFLAAAPSGDHSGGTWQSIRDFWNHYFAFPGFELWKFINLAIFVAFIYYVINKPLSAAFKAKREQIREELIKAEEEKQAALSQLSGIEAKLIGADAEKTAIMNAARTEVAEELKRLAEQGASEAAKIKAQAEGEVSRLGAVATLGLRRFSIDESLRMAEEKLRAKIDPSTDTKLIDSGIRAIGGAN